MEDSERTGVNEKSNQYLPFHYDVTSEVAEKGKSLWSGKALGFNLFLRPHIVI